MNNTMNISSEDLLRRALGKSKSSSKGARFDKKKNYASFWMDDLGRGNERFGLSGAFASKSNDLVKSIKLNTYRKAIASFVKILTNKEIPVRFHGSDSYTDGKSITLSTNLKDDNFDVAVGLALHEASHILMTDFSILPIMVSGNHTEVEKRAMKFPDPSIARNDIKGLLNWVEDRRIDQYVFSTSPGYKAYYHKLYDMYFNSDKLIARALKSRKFCDNRYLDSWMMHIFNMTNPNFDRNAMPGLDRVVDIINLAKISRLKDTNDALDVTLQIMDVILEFLDSTAPTSKDEEDDADMAKTEGDSGDEDGEGGEGGEGGAGGGEELTDEEIAEMEKHLQKQKEFTNGDTKKQIASHKLQTKLEQVERQGGTIESVAGKYTCLNYDVTGKEFIAAAATKEALKAARSARSNASYGSPERIAIDKVVKAIEFQQELLSNHYFHNNNAKCASKIAEGLLMGQLLGKKLQLRNESRDRIDNRLRSGKIDNRRLAAAGYGIESIFHQITVDKYKKANLHLSLDGSGSMRGINWENTVKLAAAIAKGLTFTSNVSMQISIRVTAVDNTNTPTNYTIYDSRKNTIRELTIILGSFDPNGMTPEGLCFESMIKKNQLIKSNTEIDSYFVNISDGEPGGIGGYEGRTAVQHTKAQINRMRNELGMNVLSYFINNDCTEEEFTSNYSGRVFIDMYGKSAAMVSANDVMKIAKTMNNLFMGK